MVSRAVKFSVWSAFGVISNGRLATVSSARSHIRTKIAVLFLALILCGGAPADAAQVIAAPTSHVGSFGVHSLIHQPVITANGSAARVYNVTITLADGYFIQTGYLDLSSNFTECGHTGLAYFVYTIDPNGYSDGYHIGSCGLTGTHWFSIIRSVSGNSYVWQAKMDGYPIGPPVVRYTNLGAYAWTNQANVFSEYVSTSPPPYGSTLATTEYEVAMEFLLSDYVWHGVGHAAYSSSPDASACPPYHIHLIANNDIQIKKSQTTECRAEGELIW